MHCLETRPRQCPHLLLKPKRDHLWAWDPRHRLTFEEVRHEQELSRLETLYLVSISTHQTSPLVLMVNRLIRVEAAVLPEKGWEDGLAVWCHGRGAIGATVGVKGDMAKLVKMMVDIPDQVVMIGGAGSSRSSIAYFSYRWLRLGSWNVRYCVDCMSAIWNLSASSGVLIVDENKARLVHLRNGGKLLALTNRMTFFAVLGVQAFSIIAIIVFPSICQ